MAEKGSKLTKKRKNIFIESYSEKYGKVSLKVKKDEKGSNIAEEGQN